jgi:hypothetical protein
MNGQNITRVMLEGALNGVGFVVGSAIVSWVVSLFFLHFIAFVALPILGIVLWLSFKGRRVIKARIERVKIEQFTRALGRQ